MLTYGVGGFDVGDEKRYWKSRITKLYAIWNLKVLEQMR
jgi:hypothetical protein